MVTDPQLPRDFGLHRLSLMESFRDHDGGVSLAQPPMPWQLPRDNTTPSSSTVIRLDLTEETSFGSNREIFQSGLGFPV
jgi:hypothetical protein